MLTWYDNSGHNFCPDAQITAVLLKISFNLSWLLITQFYWYVLNLTCKGFGAD